MFTIAPPVTLSSAAEITLRLPDGQEITLPSEIRHAAPSADSSRIEVGVQFKHLDVAVQKQLDLAVQKQRETLPS